MASTSTPNPTDLGILGQLPLELRFMVYEHALPQRILRVYRDWDLEHVFIDALSAPDLALFTWFSPSRDVLFLSTPHRFPKLRATPSPAMESTNEDSTEGNSTDGDGNQSQTAIQWTTEPSHGSDCVCGVYEALSDITKVTESLLYTGKHYDSLRMAMIPGLFPRLRQILFTAYIKAMPDQRTWDSRRAVFTQRSIIKRPGEPAQRIKCTPLSLSRLADTASYTGNSDKRVSDRLLIEKWQTTTFSKFSWQGCKERLPYARPIHRDLVERQVAVARHYWNSAYTAENDGSRVYPYYSTWERDVWANSPEVLALLPSVPDIVPVFLWMTG
ncbi:hypothetical protein PG997_008033 [Apiospora hydei]|uniref:Uncharacterized protein n=1 Tax=Apiospora hydei TaxID=1337664 RepID=A0ABR1W9P0_9PEZI